MQNKKQIYPAETKELAMEFLNWIVGHATRNYTSYEDRHMFYTDNNQVSSIENWLYSGYLFADRLGWVVTTGGSLIELSDSGRNLLDLWRVHKDEPSLLDDENANHIKLIAGTIARTHPLISDSSSRIDIIRYCLGAVIDFEEQCKLALSIMAANDADKLTKALLKESKSSSESTKAMLEENKRLADLTKSMLAENRRLGDETKDLKRATVAMSFFTLLIVFISGYHEWASSQSEQQTKEILSMLKMSITNNGSKP